MLPLHNVASSVIAELVRRQPASKERTAFAWSIAVGPAIARVTTVELEGGVLTVRAADPRWIREIERGTGVILPRLQHLLGAEPVRELRVLTPSPAGERHA